MFAKDSKKRHEIMNAAITGATKGIGYAIARVFAAEGFNLAVTARSEADLAAWREVFRRDFPQCQLLALAADLSDKAQAQSFARQTREAFPAIDVLVNNAGLFRSGPILSEADEAMEEMMAVNLFAPYYICKLLAPALIGQPRAHIFNICSSASRQALPGKGAYGVTKGALLALTQALRLELRKQQVRVTAVLPGPTWSASWEGAELPPERLMPAEDLARAIWSAWAMAPTTVVEEILLQPMEGDLGEEAG